MIPENKEKSVARDSPLARRLRFGHLLLLEALRDHGTLHEAAERMRLTRSAMSKALREIELAAGCQLFTRTRRGLQPNAVGSVYVRGAQRMLNDLGATSAEASVVIHGDDALVRIGAPPFLCVSLVPAAVKGALKSIPGMRVQVMQDTVMELGAALCESRLDCLFASLSSELLSAKALHGLTVEKLYPEEIQIIAPRQAPWTRKRSWRLEDLSEARWVVPTSSNGLRQEFERMFFNVGSVPPAAIVETSSVFSLAALAVAANALTILPAPLARLAVKTSEVIVLKVLPRRAMRQVAMFMQRGVPISPAVEALRAAAKASVVRDDGS